MAAHIKVSGRLTSSTVKGTTKAQPCNIREDGNRINFMVLDILCGKMEGFIRAIMLMARRKELERILTQMVRNILVSGMLEYNMDKEKFTMLINKLRRENGLMVRKIIHDQIDFYPVYIFSPFLIYMNN